MSRVFHPFHAPFPVDIEEHIIDRLAEHVAPLRNCSLTCRAWLLRSRYHLFRTIRISTKAIRDAIVDYFQETPHMRCLVRSLAILPAPAERLQLLGTHPAILFQILPNLRRWEMGVPGGDAPKVCFHRTTLIQLRCSPITELRLSSIQFTSKGEFMRLVSSIPLLRVLECVDVSFGTANGVLFRRRPLGLSTLQVSELGHYVSDNIGNGFTSGIPLEGRRRPFALAAGCVAVISSETRLTEAEERASKVAAR